MTTFTQRLLDIYRADPDRIAIHFIQGNLPDKAISYAELLRNSLGYAQQLTGAGIRPGEVVILILQHSQALLYAFFGAILAGAIPSIMPFLTEKLSPDQYRRSLAALFEITAPTAVITYPDFFPEVQQAVKSAPSVRCVIDSAQIEAPLDFDAAHLPGLGRAPADIVLLQHSSGTTGLQKGVALSHQAVFNQLENYSKAIAFSRSDVVVSWLPLYHDMGLIAGFIMPVLCQAPLVLMSPFDWVRSPHRLLAAVSTYHGTLSWLPNFAYNFCAQKIRDRDLEGVDLSSWRAVINCSEPMYFHSHQQFLERFRPYTLPPTALATCYAMAENVFAVSQGGIDAPVTVDRIRADVFTSQHIAQPAREGEPTINMLSAGRPIQNTRLRILDKRYHELPDRHIGEVAILSDCMLSGYYQRPDLTAKSFHDGWYLTGDLGYLADGEIYITGRKKDLIIVGGKNIYPQDLENLASEVPGVHAGRVAAFGIYNDRAGTEDVVIIAEAGGEQTHQNEVELSQEQQQEIADTIRQHITKNSDIALRFVKVVERGWLIKTSSGKVARSANREKYLLENIDQG